MNQFAGSNSVCPCNRNNGNTSFPAGKNISGSIANIYNLSFIDAMKEIDNRFYPFCFSWAALMSGLNYLKKIDHPKLLQCDTSAMFTLSCNHSKAYVGIFQCSQQIVNPIKRAWMFSSATFIGRSPKIGASMLSNALNPSSMVTISYLTPIRFACSTASFTE